MANVFKNYTSESVGTSEVTVYTVPADTTAIILGCNLASTYSSSVDVTVKINTTHLIKDVPVPSGSALSVLDGKIVAEAGDTIKVTSDTASSVDVVVSVMEQS